MPRSALPGSASELAWNERLRALYGEEIGGGAPVVHVAAVAATRAGRLPVFAPVPESPASPTDAFALEAARARVDAIVTTGEILRREGELSHALSPAAAAWRREVLGKDDPPCVVVLTRRPEEVVGHPALGRRGGCVILTSGARATVSSVAGSPVYGGRSDSLAEALRFLAAELSLCSLLIEAGPRTARELYGERVLVDELLLSVCESPRLARAALVGEFASAALIASVFGAPAHEHTEESDGVRWRFLRYLRRPSSGGTDPSRSP